MKTIIQYTSLIALSSMLVACGSGGAANKVEGKAVATASTTAAPSTTIPSPQVGGYSNIDNNQLAQMMKDGVTLVDIRRKEEWQQTGIIKGAKTITFFDKYGRINPNFVSEFKALVKPDQPVALICRTGNRTRAASQAISQQLGYKKVYNVSHGMMSWIAEKRPVVAYK